MMKDATASRTERNYGIDLLRIVSMAYVVILHVLGRGGVLNAVKSGTSQYYLAHFLEMWSLCAVNIFAIISGYVGFSQKEKKYNYAHYPVMWAQVVTYGILAFIVTFLIDRNLVTVRDLYQMLFPVTYNHYWYFTAYTALFFLIPYINTVIRHCSEVSLRKLLLLIFVLFSFYDLIPDRFGLNKGYSFAWLALLYVVGAIIKKCRIGSNLSPAAALAGILICTLLSWGWSVCGIEFTIFSITVNQGTAFSYVMPTHLCSAILHLILFSRLQLPGFARKFTVFAAPGAFAVYLLNTQRFVWRHIMLDNFAYLADSPLHVIFLHIGIFTCIFVLLAVSVDFLRQKAFKMLKINTLSARMIAAIERMLERITFFSPQ